MVEGSNILSRANRLASVVQHAILQSTWRIHAHSIVSRRYVFIRLRDFMEPPQRKAWYGSGCQINSRVEAHGGSRVEAHGGSPNLFLHRGGYSMEATWRLHGLHGDSMAIKELHRESMESPWRVHGESTETPWRFHETSMRRQLHWLHGFSVELRDSHGVSMEAILQSPHGAPWGLHVRDGANMESLPCSFQDQMESFPKSTESRQ